MDSLHISVAENGLILRYDDPEIRAQNRKSNSEWQDPERQRVYETPEALLVDLSSLVPGMRKKEDSDGSEFDEAVSEAFSKVGSE